MAATQTTLSRLWRDEESDILLWGLVLVALIVVLLVRSVVVSQTRPYSGPAVSLSYPARWADQTQTGQLLSGLPLRLEDLFECRKTLRTADAHDRNAGAPGRGGQRADGVLKRLWIADCGLRLHEGSA